MKLRAYYWTTGVKDALGPGKRAVVWVQGCSLRCKGCIAPEMWNHNEGILVEVSQLAEELFSDESIEGLTVSGGEPSEQAEAVGELLSYAKSFNKNTWVYTGHTIDELVKRNDSAIDKMLACTDVLVDGRYDIHQVGTFLWKGSGNQRQIHLTDSIKPISENEQNIGRIELELDRKGSVVIVGVPPIGFLESLKEKVKEHGIELNYERR